MTRDRVLRMALWASIPLNLAGGVLFLSAAAGHPSSLLPSASPFYAAQSALVALLFAGVYAWLATHRPIVSPLLLVGALGKLGFFAIFVVFWLSGDLSGAMVGRASPDLVLGAIYVWWLTTRPRS